ncbi:hypothetical protein DRW03_32250 [Corallococcus sp. H22C18031201]|nr:hypothetical protein DRW03_32250 [Corallococcus sp. H22C18031201]
MRKLTTVGLLTGLMLGGTALAQDMTDKAQDAANQAQDSASQAQDSANQAKDKAKDMSNGMGGSGSSQTPSDSSMGTGGASATAPSGSSMQGEKKEMTAKVLGMSSDSLFLEGDNGVAIPVKVTHETQLAGKKLKKDDRIESHLKKDFQMGEEVRTSFEVKHHKDGKVENVATSIDKQ